MSAWQVQGHELDPQYTKNKKPNLYENIHFIQIIYSVPQHWNKMYFEARPMAIILQVDF